MTCIVKVSNHVAYGRIRCDSCKLHAQGRHFCLLLLQILMLIEGAVLQTKENRTKTCKHVSSRMPMAAHQLLPSNKSQKTSCQVSNVTLSVFAHCSALLIYIRAPAAPLSICMNISLLFCLPMCFSVSQAWYCLCLCGMAAHRYLLMGCGIV